MDCLQEDIQLDDSMQLGSISELEESWSAPSEIKARALYDASKRKTTTSLRV